MKRIYQNYINEFIHKKIILISGPRQSGKTTLSKMGHKNFVYLNYDNEDDRKTIKEMSWDKKIKLIIFDELHKKTKWKQWLKGIYDKNDFQNNFIVTGSARLDTFKKVGDSLAGRYFHYRLHPLDVREICNIDKNILADDAIETILNYSGFPEPYLANNKRFYNLWKKTHLDIILRQDLIALEDVRDLKSIELLIDLLKERVGSPISYSNLARDLQVSDKTVKHWLQILENIYVIFKLTPFSKNIARSNLKQPKYYFYDIARVTASDGAKFENLIACSLLKEVQFRSDCLGEDWELAYLSKKGGLEIDFAITFENKLKYAIEVKLSDANMAKNFLPFISELKDVEKIQLVKNLKVEKMYPNGVEIRKASKWLCSW
ncbi:MAG: ATP-binding protein [Bacteriovorax sp.]|nr:ATP-binding protein [Bacteriovorax sp.]